VCAAQSKLELKKREKKFCVYRPSSFITNVVKWPFSSLSLSHWQTLAYFSGPTRPPSDVGRKARGDDVEEEDKRQQK